MLDFAVGQERLEVALDQRHIACSRHGEPFRANWPEGWSIFALAVSSRALGSPALQTGLQDPRFWRSIDMVWEDLPQRKTPSQVRQMLETRPACEWVSPEQVLEAYRASGIGVVRLCQVCRLFRDGTPYSVTEHGQVRRIHHVCFRCVLDNRVGAK